MDTIDIDGERYIKASEAAKELGYTTDYVGQLARAGKISAKRIGRVWFVGEGELGRHKKDNVRSNKQKTQEAIHRAVTETSRPGQIHHVLHAPHPGLVPEYRKRLMDTHIRYERDEHPIKLHLESKSRTTEIRDIEPPEEEVEEVEEEQEEVHLSVIDSDRRVKLNPKSEEKHEQEVAVHEPALHGEVKVSQIESVTEDDYEETLSSMEMNEEKTNFLERLRAQDIEPPHQSAEEILSALAAEEEERGVVSEVPARQVHREKIRPIPRQRAGSLPAVVMASLLVVAFGVSLSSVFLQGEWVYEHGKGVASRPSYETSYGVRELSAVIEAVRALDQ